MCAMPASTGKLCTNIADMKVGDYIVCNYNVPSSGVVGTFTDIGTGTRSEIAVAGANIPNGTFYFVKVAKGLLCADRVVQHSITWDVLNAGKVIQGKPTTFGTYDGVIRSLTGGVAYADANGNMSTTDKSLGAWPTNNEWDRYIVNFDSKYIQSGKTVDDVFHHTSAYNWTQDTWISTNTNRIARGYTANLSKFNYYLSSTTGSIGFRPTFEYQES